MNDRPAIDDLFHAMCRIGASDLHLSVGSPPIVRKDGHIQMLEEQASPMTAELLGSLVGAIMPERNAKEFEERHDTDFAYEIPELARFRANVFADRKGTGAVFRVIPSKILTAEQLGLSSHVLQLCRLTKGLVLVTGPTGSGKSTTLAAMVDYVNRTRQDHIITIEDPIEFVHPSQRCLVNQREVRTHTDSFKSALRAALREDPDVVLVGELRDLETVAIAIETAETGHLVFGTLHTTTAASTVDRIIDQFPADRQAQIRIMLSESLRGVIAQTLCRKIGGGRVAALEVLIADPRGQQSDSRGQDVPAAVDHAGQQGCGDGQSERRPDGARHPEAGGAGRGARQGGRQGRVRDPAQAVGAECAGRRRDEAHPIRLGLTAATVANRRSVRIAVRAACGTR